MMPRNVCRWPARVHKKTWGGPMVRGHTTDTSSQFPHNRSPRSRHLHKCPPRGAQVLPVPGKRYRGPAE
eukprot:5071553-Pyramimonas_sp.AAC.1